MKKLITFVSIILLVLSSDIFSQGNYYGLRLGLSLARGEAKATPELGFQVGGMLEHITASNFGFGTEFNINTQPGTPKDLAIYVKYYFTTNVTGLKYYVSLAGDLWFFEGGPYGGAKIGAGMDMQLSRHFAIPIDLQYGQAFISGDNAAYFGGTTGVKFKF